MIAWRVRFDEPVGLGWLVLNSDAVAVGLFHDDGTPADEIKGYTTIDTSPTAPDWLQEMEDPT